MNSHTITLKIKRQDSPESSSYWSTFKLPFKPFANIISCLQEIQRNPITVEGKEVPPVVWDCNCLEEVCGSCTMLINGQVQQACTALVDKLMQPIVLEPMSKFPVVRDLQVDRSRMFENLKKVKEPANNICKPFHIEIENYLNKKYKKVSKIKDFYKGLYKKDIFFEYFSSDRKFMNKLGMEKRSKLEHRFDAFIVG